MKYLALLRGINVGGKNPVRMGALRAVLEQLPLDNVRTYIQSGNVLFESKVASPVRLSGAIEHVLTQEFGFAPVVVVVTEQQLECVVANAPARFGSEPESYRYDVAFVKPPLEARDVLSTIALKPGVVGRMRRMMLSISSDSPNAPAKVICRSWSSTRRTEVSRFETGEPQRSCGACCVVPRHSAGASI